MWVNVLSQSIPNELRVGHLVAHLILDGLDLDAISICATNLYARSEGEKAFGGAELEQMFPVCACCGETPEGNVYYN